MIVHLVAGAQRIGHDHEEVRPVEREVVVAAVPDDDVGLLLRLAEDGLVVDAGVEDAAGVEVRLVLLALLDGRLVPVEVRVGRESLDALLDEVAVGHRVADDDDAEALLLEQAGEVARGLALAGAGPGGPGGDERLAAGDHRADGPQEHEVGPAGERPTGLVHHVLVGDVAVGEDDAVDRLAGEDLLEVVLGDDGDPGRVEGPGELGRVAPVGDAGDLGGREGDDLHGGVVAIDDVEVMEVAPGGPHDHDLRAVHGSSAPPGRRGERSRPVAIGAPGRADDGVGGRAGSRPGPGGRPIQRVSGARQAAGKGRAARPRRDVRAGEAMAAQRGRSAGPGAEGCPPRRRRVPAPRRRRVPAPAT